MAWNIIDSTNLEYFLKKLKDIFNTKVDKIEGKGLSTNDFDDEYQTKVSSLTDLAFTDPDDIVRSVKIGAGGAELKNDQGTVILPAYPDFDTLDSSVTATDGYALTGITEENGKLTGKTEIKIPTTPGEVGAQSELTPAQLDAVNSGITNTKVKTYDSINTDYVSKKATSLQKLNSAIQVGNNTTNVVNAYLHMRKINSTDLTGKSVNGACFSVNGDGSASFQHKIYNDDGTGAKNAAILRFYGTSEGNGKLQFAVNTGSGASPTDDMYKDVAFVSDVSDKYTKPSDGIPKTDLSSDVQTSLGKADTALQSFTETDPTVPSHVKNITSTDISNWSGKAEISDIPTKPSDIGAMAATVTSLSGDVPITRKVNGKALSGDITLTATDIGAATAQDISDAIAALPEPMVFKGSLGTGGTVTTLPAAASTNEGYTYKVITAGTYASQAAKIGDTFISDGSKWVLIPSGDEPNGTVTSIAIKMNGTQVGSAVTTSGTIDLGTVITDVSGKENSSNKVSSWSATTTDAHYPSEKLVKSSLDGKANSSHTHTTSDISNFPTSMTPTAHNQASNTINAMTGYSKASAAAAIAATDSLNVAIGKLEKALDGKQASGNYLTGITSSQVTTALGFTPYNSTNPNGYTSNAGTVTSVAIKMNGAQVGSAITSNGTIDLGTVATSNTWRPLGTGANDAAAGNHTHSQYLTSHQDISGKANTSGTYSGLSVGYATSSTSATKAGYVESKGNYTFDANTLPNSFDYGISAGFVNSNSGFGSFGTVLTARTYTGGGGTLQLYAPYSPTYGGTHLKARFGNYDVSNGNSWTNLKEIAWVSDIPSLSGYATETWVTNKGYTTNTGTVTSVAVKMNNTTKGTITSSGTIDLGTVITAHQDISGKADKASITAGTAGTSSATSGASLAVPYVTVNAQGIVTGYGTHTHTISGFSTTDTKNTAGSTDTSSKIYLVGATSQAANPQTYSDNQVYATNGQLDANKIRVAEKVTFEYDSTNECLNLNFA